MICALLLLTQFPVVAGAVPLTATEVGLMLRSGYSSEAVLQELTKRKFADTFDSEVEKQLVKAGASQSLIDAFRSGAYQLSASEMSTARNRIAAAQARVASHQADQALSNSAARTVEKPQLSRPQEGGTMYDHLKDDLVYWHEGTFAEFDDETLQKKKFYLLFFSAIWSREGREFTARLIDYYNRVASQHPEFEVIFFSADRSAFAMENYVSQTKMPWPAVAYEKLQGKAGALAENFTHKIPRLILAEASGRVLSDSGENQADFDKVLADTDKVLGGPDRP